MGDALAVTCVTGEGSGMRQHSFLRRVALAGLATLLLLLGTQSSRADEWYPGLPDLDNTTGASWMGAAQGGLSYAKRAKQWFRSPMGMVTFTSITNEVPNDDPLVDRFSATGTAYVVSPEGAPENYGYMEPMTVRSVGFGLIPVEATVRVSQRRRNGLPIPLKSTLSGADHRRPGALLPYKQVADPTVVEDAFNVEILKVLVDGQDLQLSGNCRTVTPAPVRMVGPGYTIPDPFDTPTAMEDWYRTTDPTEFFHPFYGGELTGAMTIPAFTGCTTATGDDLSALMTLSVSGPGNPVNARVGWPCTKGREGVGWPVAPGQSNPKATARDGWSNGTTSTGCDGSAPFDYPARPRD